MGGMMKEAIIDIITRVRVTLFYIVGLQATLEMIIALCVIHIIQQRAYHQKRTDMDIPQSLKTALCAVIM